METENEVKPPVAPAPAAAPKVPMAKVKVLRPFRVLNADGTHTIHDKINSIVQVPKADLPWLTKPIKGMPKGFGDRLEEECEHHVIRRAELVA